MKLEDAIVLITGAHHGIGLAFRRGCIRVVHARHMAALSAYLPSPLRASSP